MIVAFLVGLVFVVVLVFSAMMLSGEAEPPTREKKEEEVDTGLELREKVNDMSLEERSYLMLYGKCMETNADIIYIDGIVSNTLFYAQQLERETDARVMEAELQDANAAFVRSEEVPTANDFQTNN